VVAAKPEKFRFAVRDPITFTLPLRVVVPATARVLVVIELVPIARTKSEFATARVLVVIELVPRTGT
jgi:hypothetical protein